MTIDQHDKIRERAHQLWERADRPEGRDEVFWLEAERELAEEEEANRTDEAEALDMPTVVPGGMA